MPELPEVEIIARRLREGNKREPKIVGRTIVDVAVPSTKVVKEPSRAAFIKALTGARVTAVKRRAKHLVLETDAGALLVHLRLTGDLHVVPDLADGALKFLRAGFAFDNGKALAFTDGRHLGEMRLLDDAAAHLAHLGPEPLDDSFTVAVLAQIVSGKKRPVKAVLLDQEAIAGVGNIYSDESCFLAQIHPATSAASLDKAAIKRLHAAIRKSLADSIKALVDDDGEIAWRYQNRQGKSPFRVYDRAGEPCTRCGKKLVSSRVAGRATVTCPQCQKKPARSS